MKDWFLLVFAALLMFPALSQEKILKLYVGTFTSEGADGIYLCDFDTESGQIRLNRAFKGIDNPNFLKISSDRRFMYVAARPPKVIEKSGGYISAYQIDSNGLIHFINKQSSNGDDPCYIDVSADGKYVVTSTYGSGTLSLYPINSDGSLQSASSVVQNVGNGPNMSRQNSPHAHSIRFSPFSNQVFSADLGTDQVDIFEIENNQLVKKGQPYVKIASGSGPRHLDFLTDKKVIYVINELNSTVTVLKNDGTFWNTFQTVTTLPSGFKGENYCADIHISPNGKFLYGSNRGDNSIAIFVIESSSQTLISIGTVLTEGNWPRNFIISPDGKFMLVANQKSGNISVFKIQEESGVPAFTGMELRLPSPVCLGFL